MTALQFHQHEVLKEILQHSVHSDITDNTTGNEKYALYTGRTDIKNPFQSCKAEDKFTAQGG